MDPTLHFATTSDDVGIAFWTMGDGPPLLIPPTLVTNHLELEWQLPTRRAAFEGLAHGARIVRYDCRGMGMSQHDAVDFSVEAGFRDLEAVIDRLDLDQFAMLRVPSSGDLPFAYTAAHPERVSHFVIWEGHPQDDMDPPRQRQIKAIEPVIDADWDLYVRIRSRIQGGWDGSNAPTLEEILRATHTPASAKAMNQAILEANPQPYLAQIKAPTLVMYRLGNRSREDNARLFASRIPNAQLVTHHQPTTGIYPNLDGIEAILEFINPEHTHLRVDGHEAAGDALRVILFSDLEEHTPMMQRLGDEAGRAVLREHEAITRDALMVYGGYEVKTMGDSFMASFGSATRALECAVAIQRAFATRNETASEPLHVRVGLSAGEPIAEDADLFGSSVILAARIAGQAKGGEIVLANVVRELAAGKGFLFADRGETLLRGFEDPVRLFELKWDQSGAVTS
jgi:class 3 adenylate cyclase/pimeloyl-ACP methyl ester carboxylesterase